ncbi:MAG: hypothetical protein WD403_11085 [Pirellulales bacterium]|jgi:hypothetical protein
MNENQPEKQSGAKDLMILLGLTVGVIAVGVLLYKLSELLF